MTTQSENDHIDEINENNQAITVIQELSVDKSNINEDELPTEKDKKSRNNSIHEIEEKNNNNDDSGVNSSSITTVNTNEEQEQQKESTINNIEDDNRSKRSFNSKVKYPSVPYYRSPYYTNGYPYGPAPYYYYPMSPFNEKPTPLMVIPTQPPPPPSSSSAATTTTTTTVTDNQTGNSTTVSPQNLPPRLRQASTSENDSNLQQSTSSLVSTTSNSQPTTTNSRRHRSILPRGSCNYYAPHPPPLMATPPGVLFPYPPTAHQPGHIAYNIRTPDELELLAFQQQIMNLPPSVIWPPPSAYAPYSPYSMYGPSPYMYNNSSTINSNSSLLNPDAAEWVPTCTDTDTSSSDNNILIDDEINFPPLNNHRVEENNSEAKTQTESSSEIISTNNTNDNTTITPSKIDSSIPNSTSSQDDNKNLLLSSTKVPLVTYSTVILQTPDVNKSNKNLNTNNKYQQQQQQQPSNVQLSAKDRTMKPQQQQQHPTQTRTFKDNSSRRRPFPSNRTNYNKTRNVPSAETPKQQEQLIDDWIEVKSKKTKKFDRSYNDIQYVNSSNTSQKLVSDEQIHKTLSPPSSSLSSVGDNTTTTTNTSDDDDDLNNVSNNNPVMIVENKIVPTTISTDYNQVIIDDIHARLDNDEKLLIIMRGCPGSGKSTLARSLNDGYDGQILSIDEYFNDLSKFEHAQHYNQCLASDAFKQNISPIIIDNTNTTSWEIKPYVILGKEAGYDILLIEPQTPWRYKARELAKRNVHNLPLRRIKEILNRFEHNITVQNITDQMQTNLFLPCQSQQIFDQHQTDNESIDPILISKKSYDTIDDINILNDVRLCINDMILFLTSNFYQSSTSLLLPFSDLSLIPTSPTTPSTPHSLFHRSLSRFSSTTANQDHSFTSEHLLRLPTAAFSRCIENLTPPSSTNSSIIGKKRRKNKNKQETSTEMLFNTNNNNNNNMINMKDNYSQQSTYNVFLPEDCSDFIVIDEQNNNDDSLENFTEQFYLQGSFSRDNSSVTLQQQTKTTNKKSELLDIIHNELTTSSASTDPRPSISINHIAIQCSSNNFNEEDDSSDRILIGHVSSTSSTVSSPISPPAGYTERGIQVDLDEHYFDSLSQLIEFYSEHVSSDIIKQFYELCNSDIQWTRTQVDDYLQHIQLTSTFPTLRQLSLNALNIWNEQIKHSNPSFDTISIGDLLQDINDEDVFEELILENETTKNSIEITDTNQLTIPWSIIYSLQELYGELPTKSDFSYTADGLSLPLDDGLSMDIYQALQRFLGVSTKTTKPVNEKKLIKENKKINKQQPPATQRNLPSQNESNKKNNSPSLQQIMNEELNYISSQKSVQKRQLDFASQHKLKELELHFPNMSSDVIYDIFRENESDYDLTLVCISSMLDVDPSITPRAPKSPSSPPQSSSTNIRSTTTNTTIPTKSIIEPVLESYETSRRDARNYALNRKDCYLKADQANRHGMTGVASYYINQAREQTRLMKDANRVACEYLSRTRLIQFRQTHRLDLHELHADEALTLFKQVEQELCEGNRRTTPKSIEIITGYGKSSPFGGGYGKIRSVILSYLRQKNYK
ncbi:unnamed protein product [Adineta steineri]|uniref:Smr domain-containing protein n=1 Tax=Adineta steineri TaxID=433720 RepID=A0A818S9K5_9BILA|nr:unnamed protein product [Adineta steineri]CAF3666253.1 unnamed protein product [Adineta steineri]